jgi:hypothetical protein
MPVGVPCLPKGRGPSRLVLLPLQSTFGRLFISRGPRWRPCATLVRMARSPFRLRGFAGLPAWCSCHFRALSVSIFIPRPRVATLATLVRMTRSPFRLRGGILVSSRIPCAHLGSLSVSRSPWDIYNIPQRVIECKLFLFVKITE